MSTFQCPLKDGGIIDFRLDDIRLTVEHMPPDPDLENARLDRGIFQFLLGVSLIANAILGTILVMA